MASDGLVRCRSAASTQGPTGYPCRAPNRGRHRDDTQGPTGTPATPCLPYDEHHRVSCLPGDAPSRRAVEESTRHGDEDGDGDGTGRDGDGTGTGTGRGRGRGAAVEETDEDGADERGGGGGSE